MINLIVLSATRLFGYFCGNDKSIPPEALKNEKHIKNLGKNPHK